MRWHVGFCLFCTVWAAEVLVASGETELTITLRIPTQLLNKPFSVQQKIPVVIESDSGVHMQVDAVVSREAGGAPPGLPPNAVLDDLSDLPQEAVSKWLFLTTFLKKHPYLSFGGIASLVWYMLATFDPEVRDVAKHTTKKAYNKVSSLLSRLYRSMSY